MKTTISILYILAAVSSSNKMTDKQQLNILNADMAQICLPSVKPTPYIVWIDTCASRYNIPREVILGIASNESKFGSSFLGRTAHNWFGIKKGDYTGDYYTSSKGNKWRKYPSPYESIEDFCKYITTHYSHLIGRPLERWNIYGYAESPYLASYFLTFKNF